MPKTISSLPTGAINRTDNLITATDGSDELKRNTVDELLAGPTADITALQTENAELKEKIAEMEEEISELNSDLTRVDISSAITLDSSYDYGVIRAYKLGGWVYIRLQIKAESGPNAYGTISSEYVSVVDRAMGFYSVTSSTSDAGKVNSAYISNDGSIYIWATSDLSNQEYFTFVYPLRT